MEGGTEMYLKCMKAAKEWGDGIILLAASAKYRRSIIITNMDSNQEMSRLGIEYTGQPMRLGFMPGSQHYVSLREEHYKSGKLTFS